MFTLEHIGHGWICAECGSIILEWYKSRVPGCACGSVSFGGQVKIYKPHKIKVEHMPDGTEPEDVNE